MKHVSDILIVGGGDVGTTAALALQKFNPNASIRVVDDFDHDPPAVGKSTFSLIHQVLFKQLELPFQEFVREVKPVWKFGVEFNDWFDNDPFLAPFTTDKFPVTETVAEQRDEWLYRYQSGDFTTLSEELLKRNRTPLIDSRIEHHDTAFHLSLPRFNPYLHQVCQRRGIELINDRITNVSTSDGMISSVESETETYDADLFIDAGGFNRPLFSQLQVPYEEFDLPYDAAVKVEFPIGLAEIHPATVVDSASAGWTWQIDTVDGRDVGYVYSTSHTTECEAIQELCSRFPRAEGQDIQSVSFTAGMHTEAWRGNCVALGNAYGFIEPVQSTALTVAIQSAITLAELLASHNHYLNGRVKDAYNTHITRLWDDVHNFIKLHYAFIEPDTEFERTLVNATSDVIDSYANVRVYDEHGFTMQDWHDTHTFPPEGFRVPLTCWMLYHLGVDSTHYDELIASGVEPDSAVVDRIQSLNDEYSEQATSFMTYPEVYGNN